MRRRGIMRRALPPCEASHTWVVDLAEQPPVLVLECVRCGQQGIDPVTFNEHVYTWPGALTHG